MKRRQFCMGTAAALLAVRFSTVNANALTQEDARLPLWNNLPDGNGGPTGAEEVSNKGAFRHISRPSLLVFKPTMSNGKAVLIAAGGGYKRIEIGTEALPAAHWLTARGYTAYVLVYRLPSESWQDASLVALQDAQRALRIVRSRHPQVSVLGFSAGGHLLGMAATRPDLQSYPAQDALDAAPAYADGAALIYPIITLEAPYTHTSTYHVLLGKAASPEEERKWSVQPGVNRHTPPMFLVQAEDDPISDPQNTLIMAAACEREHVPVEMHRYSTGGHGFGMGRPGTPTVEWPTHYEAWLRRVGR